MSSAAMGGGSALAAGGSVLEAPDLSPEIETSCGPEIKLRIIKIIPNAEKYISLFRESLIDNTNDILEKTLIPETDEQFLEFFTRAIAKEIKLIFNSTHKSANTSRRHFRIIYKALISNSQHYKDNGINNVVKTKTPEVISDYIIDSDIIFRECIQTLQYGTPGSGYIKDFPTYLFLYYRQPSIYTSPIYSAHIFVQPRVVYKDLYFVSIYKSLHEKKRGISSCILDDVENYALKNKLLTIFTQPLKAMVKSLFNRGFKRVFRSAPGTEHQIGPSYDFIKLINRNVDVVEPSLCGAGGCTIMGGGGKTSKTRKNTKTRHRQKTLNKRT